MSRKRQRNTNGDGEPIGVCSINDTSSRQLPITNFFSGRPKLCMTPPTLPAADDKLATTPPTEERSQSSERKLTPPTPAATTGSCSFVRPKHQHKQLSQSYLDCGQRNWGQRICQDCGMLFVPGVKKDETAHDRRCKEVQNGVLWRTSGLVGQKIVSLSADDSIVLIKPTQKPPASTWKRVMEIVSQDLGMESPKESSSNTDTTPLTILLYLRLGRVVGVLIMEPIRTAYFLISLCEERSSMPSKAMLGVTVLWTHAQARHQGIATKLLDTARAHAVFGMPVPKSQLAISSPTTAGWAFFKRYSLGAQQDGAVLVYDYKN